MILTMAVLYGILTRVVTMHRYTWAGDACIVSRPVYRDT